MVSFGRAMQVLDLGVTRQLVHRLVAIFPSLCQGFEPACGSFVATYAESNRRLQFLGRRYTVTLAGSVYVPGDVTGNGNVVCRL